MSFIEGILEFLKKKFNLNLTINLTEDNSKKITFRDNVIVLGNQTINDPTIVDAVYNKLAEYKSEDSFPFQLLHKNLEKDFKDYESISIKEKCSLSQLKEVLPTRDLECILMARRVHLAYEQNDSALIKELLNQLKDNFPNEGKKVLNLMSGKYFDEVIIPFIEVFKNHYGEPKYVNEFRSFYSDQLKFFPLAVFVGNVKTEDHLRKEIEKRLTLKGVPFIRLHAIGEDNIKKIENVIKELKINEKYTTETHNFTTSGGLRAQMFEIKLK